MWKKILRFIGKNLFLIGFELVYKTIDTNKDGKICKDEIREFIRKMNEKLKNLV